jgi:hypothetical protein
VGIDRRSTADEPLAPCLRPQRRLTALHPRRPARPGRPAAAPCRSVLGSRPGRAPRAVEVPAPAVALAAESGGAEVVPSSAATTLFTSPAPPVYGPVVVLSQLGWGQMPSTPAEQIQSHCVILSPSTGRRRCQAQPSWRT